MERGGTEAFPNLGEHCGHPDCHRLDFLPFNCDGCLSSFCLEHRSYDAHDCPKPGLTSRRVAVCKACSAAIETTSQDEGVALLRHENSGECDPSKRKKSVCPVERCRERLTFSNTCECKTCQVKVCLRHRFPADHACKGRGQAGGVEAWGWNEKFLVALAIRSRSGAKDCGKEENEKKKKKKKKGTLSPKRSPSTSIKAF
ncbi:hypothetical protein MLD38_000402 [Melastoma candidum]|uniref:Uncharacterized protein n=1 Tax=Melastoma candidum TaxID=119954 RepID=A0ACB9SD83_9MYRT|nr:hypothetical protein MLD38_000402 [Melastoma candidum]